MEQRIQLAIIGGGASGMAAAIAAAETAEKRGRDIQICVLEQAPRVGKKLLATGNGRCNLSNQAMDKSRYHGGADWAEPILKTFTTKAVLRQFQQMGLLCRTDEAGRVYPYNQQASAVLEILRLQMEKHGIEIRCDCLVETIQKDRQGFLLQTAQGARLRAERVILAAGGKAAPKLGGIGGGTALAKQLGHTIVPELPALVQLTSDRKRMKQLKGMRSQAVVTLRRGQTVLGQERGEVQFTEHGLSGICVFQLSGLASRLLSQGEKLTLSLHLMPEWKADALQKQIAGQSKRYPQLPARELLCGFLNRSVGQAVMEAALGDALPKTAGTLTYDQCRRIAETICDFTFPITGNVGWEQAQVTAGGVSCKEIDAKTLQSKRCKGLYLAGEVIDIDGDCGGYNLHWAWSSGFLAGRSAAEEESI